jgi:hypothetical protein
MPLLFCWCGKPEFNLAVVDYVKSDMGPDCHNHILHIAQVRRQKQQMKQIQVRNSLAEQNHK